MNGLRNSFIRAIRGPIMLITLGSLFAFDISGRVQFWRTWPLLLIVFGLLKLFERLAAGSGSGMPEGGTL